MIVLNSRWPVPVNVIVTIGPPVVVSKSCLAPDTSLPNSVSFGFFGSVNMYQRKLALLAGGGLPRAAERRVALRDEVLAGRRAAGRARAAAPGRAAACRSLAAASAAASGVALAEHALRLLVEDVPRAAVALRRQALGGDEQVVQRLLRRGRAAARDRGRDARRQRVLEIGEHERGGAADDAGRLRLVLDAGERDRDAVARLLADLRLGDAEGVDAVPHDRDGLRHLRRP